jgi:transposase-like protein
VKHNRNSKKVPEERNKDKSDKLRSENNKLRKEVKQLRKELARLQNRDDNLKEIIEEIEIDNTEVIQKIPKCPACGSPNILIIPELREGIDYYSCNQCNSRGTLNEQNKK